MSVLAKHIQDIVKSRMVFTDVRIEQNKMVMARTPVGWKSSGHVATKEDLTFFLNSIEPHWKDRLTRDKSLDTALFMEDIRLRCNVFVHKAGHSIGIVIRKLPDAPLSIVDTGLPIFVENFTKAPSGLVLVSGPTGSGKTTTLAALLQSINATREAHIVTIEDPVATFVEPSDAKTSVYRDINSGVSAIVHTSLSVTSPSAPNAVGQQSAGQYLLGSVLNELAGSNATGASRTLNPIIALKNIGNNAMSFSRTAFDAARKVDKKSGGQTQDDSTLKLSEDEPQVMERLADAAQKGSRIKTLQTSIEKIAKDSNLMLPIASGLFVAACLMSIYIPMIPFIQWFASLLQWFVSVIESLIGSSLWALAHFDSDGEGMGQRASYGYLYMLSNFARPIINTFAFFIASGAITVLGTFLFKYFGAAVASAEGNSFTSLVSVVGYLMIFGMMGISLVNGSFSLMLHMADRMISWIGHSATSNIGQDVENRVSGMFMNASRTIQSTPRPGQGNFPPGQHHGDNNKPPSLFQGVNDKKGK